MEELESKAGKPAEAAGLKPGITVIIPAFNRERFLERSIKSVLAQTVQADQVIVVDDGSTDGTPEVCRRFSGSIEYVRQSNAGVAGARNTGIKLARHAWIAFLDSDDRWTPKHLENMKAAINATAGRAGFYFADVFMVGGTEDTTLWSQIGFKFDEPFHLSPDGTDWMLSRRLPASIQSSVFNAVLLKASGGFNPRLKVMEDTELFCRLGIGAPVCAVNAVGCYYHLDDNNIDNRLTATMKLGDENYWICACKLWRFVLFHFPNLGPARRRVIRHRLADAGWRLARNYWKAGKIFHGIQAFLRCIKTQPSLLFFLLRRKAGGTQEIVCHAVPKPNQCPPDSCRTMRSE